jgi:hypothetical protein
MIKLLLISLVGIFGALYPRNDPIIPQESLRYLSRLLNLILLPFLVIYSLGSTLSIQLLSDLGVLIFYCFLVVITSYLITYTYGKFLYDGPVDGLFVAIQVSISSSNSVALPVLVMETLCADEVINADFNHDAKECFNQASIMIFVYMVGWFIMFWGYSFPLLKSAREKDHNQSINIVEKSSKLTIEIIWNAFKDRCLKIISTPVMIAVMIGFIIGLIPALRTRLFNSQNHLFVFGSAIYTLGQPVICLNCLVMAASLAQSKFPDILEYMRVKTWILRRDYYYDSGIANNAMSLNDMNMIESDHSTNHFIIDDDHIEYEQQQQQQQYQLQETTSNPLHHHQNRSKIELSIGTITTTNSNSNSNRGSPNSSHNTSHILATGNTTLNNSTLYPFPSYRAIFTLVFCK